MNPWSHDGGVFDRAQTPRPSETAPRPEAASRPAAATPQDVRRRPLLNEVGDATSRHDDYHCPAASGEGKR